MRLLLLEQDKIALGDLESRFSKICRDSFPISVEISALLLEAVLDEIDPAELVILGAGLEEKAAAVARRMRDLMPKACIIALVSEEHFKQGKIVARREGDLNKIIPEGASDYVLHKEILQSAFDRMNKNDDPNLKRTIAGRYEVQKCLGAGSMGLVYLCRHPELAGHFVAVKVLFPEVAKDHTAAHRFRHEIVAAYGVSHPNVVRAYEYFRDGDLVAYSMEYVHGGDLADKLSAGPIPIDKVIRYLSQAASGLQAIHDAGIIHRDLKPENLLISKDDEIKITDFGVARIAGTKGLTAHGGVVGCVTYVAPEYVEKSEVTTLSDIYGLGVLAYEMITGKSPFRGNSVIETMTMRINTTPVPPSVLCAECPPELDQLVLKMMARDPAERLQRADEICEELKKLRN